MTSKVRSRKAPAKAPSTADRQTRFLKALVAADGAISVACRATKMARATFYRWKQEPAFAARYDEARRMILDDLESDLLPRARKSDRLLMFLLERRFPEHYGKKAKDDALLTRTVIDPIKLQTLFTDEELAQFREYAERAVAAKVN